MTGTERCEVVTNPEASSLQPTSASVLRLEPVYTASTVSKSLPAVVRFSVPVAPAVQRNQTDDAAEAAQDGTGSKASSPAPSVDWENAAGSDPTTAADAKSSFEGGSVANVADTERAAVIDTTHVEADPEQFPPHDTNDAPASGVAVSVTDVPSAYDCEQSDGHEIPTGLDDTEPGPDTDTDNVRETAAGVNEAESSRVPVSPALPATWMRYVVPDTTLVDVDDVTTGDGVVSSLQSTSVRAPTLDPV